MRSVMSDTQNPEKDAPSARSTHPAAAWSVSKLPSLQYNFQVFTCVQQIKPDKINRIKVSKPNASTNDLSQKRTLNHLLKISIFPV